VQEETTEAHVELRGDVTRDGGGAVTAARANDGYLLAVTVLDAIRDQ
jgi:hypothetical protein